MRKGAFVLIFLVWAFITIITPILVQWSHPHQATIKPLFQDQWSSLLLSVAESEFYLILSRAGGLFGRALLYGYELSLSFPPYILAILYYGRDILVNASDEGLLKHRKMLVLIDDTNYRNVTTSFQRHMPTITIAIPPAPSPQQNRIGSS